MGKLMTLVTSFLGQIKSAGHAISNGLMDQPSVGNKTTNPVLPTLPSLPIVSTPSAEEIEEKRLASIWERAAKRQAKRRDLNAARRAEVEKTAAEATTNDHVVEEPKPSMTDMVRQQKSTITDACSEGNAALKQSDDLGLKNARMALEKADAAYRDLKELNAEATKNGVYSPIKELERAIARKSKQLEDEKAAKARLEAKEASRPVAVDHRAEQFAQAKAAAHEASKRLSGEYRGRLDKISMMLEDGLPHMAQAELEGARGLRVTANQARARLNELLGNAKKKPFSFDDLKELEQACDVQMTEKAEQEALLHTQRTWLSDYFGIGLDKDFTVIGPYQPRPALNNRCAVCLAQAKRLIVQLGKEQQLMPLHEAMSQYLLRGFKTWGVQLCHQDAKQAFDKDGRQYGHRVFKRRPALVDHHVNSETGEIENLEALEAKIERAVAQLSFTRQFDSYVQDQRVLSQHQKQKAKGNSKLHAA